MPHLSSAWCFYLWYSLQLHQKQVTVCVSFLYLRLFLHRERKQNGFFFFSVLLTVHFYKMVWNNDSIDSLFHLLTSLRSATRYIYYYIRITLKTECCIVIVAQLLFRHFKNVTTLFVILPKKNRLTRGAESLCTELFHESYIARACACVECL